MTLALRGNEVLLGMKKRGFGAGRWNGFGGKVQEGESLEGAARRETKEECGIEIGEMERVGIHEFHLPNRKEIVEVHVFRIHSFAGDPIETEEMRPKWFPTDAIPFDSMWPDDRHWFPYFLAGRKFQTMFRFGDGDTVLKMKIDEVANLPD